MLKFGASQHFQEVSHEPPGTERGEKSVGDEGMGVGRGCARVCVPVRCRRVCVVREVRVSRWMRGRCWNGMMGVCPGWSVTTWTQNVFNPTLTVSSEIK